MQPRESHLTTGVGGVAASFMRRKSKAITVFLQFPWQLRVTVLWAWCALIVLAIISAWGLLLDQEWLMKIHQYNTSQLWIPCLSIASTIWWQHDTSPQRKGLVYFVVGNLLWTTILYLWDIVEKSAENESGAANNNKSDIFLLALFLVTGVILLLLLRTSAVISWIRCGIGKDGGRLGAENAGVHR